MYSLSFVPVGGYETGLCSLPTRKKYFFSLLMDISVLGFSFVWQTVHVGDIAKTINVYL
jgi:hypothetical protein